MTATSTPHEPPLQPSTDGGFTVARSGMHLIWRFVRRQPWMYTLAAAGAVAFTAGIIASAVVIGRVTDDVIVPVLSDGAPPATRLRAAVLAIAAVGLWKTVGIIVRRTAAGWLQFNAQAGLRRELIEQQLRLSLRWHGRHRVGDLLSVSDADTRQSTMVLAPLPFATGVTALLVGTVAVITATDVILGVLALVLLATVVGIDLRGSWLTYTAMEEAQRRRGHVAEVAHESFDGALTVKALGREAVETDRLSVAAYRLRDQLVQVGRTWTGYRAVSEGLPGLGMLLLLVVGTLRIAEGVLSTGELVRAVYLLSLLAVPMRLIGYLMWDTAQSVAAWRRVEQVLDADDTVASGSLPSRRDGAADVRADAIGFGYEPGSPVLSDVAFHVRPGRTIAVVGATGSGKSTLALLLARLWDPDRGIVALDGRDLRELAAGAVAQEVAYVAQEAFLFDDTVEGNVGLGRDVGRERIAEALELASADAFVAALPHGMHTMLGERGATLSGGQQQRIALARALAGQPRLLVLDDATSAVDPSVEARILRRLRDAELPATVIVVAYRRATILQADEVVFLADGRVLAHGPHEQLVIDVPAYARLLDAYEHDAALRASAADHELGGRETRSRRARSREPDGRSPADQGDGADGLDGAEESR